MSDLEQLARETRSSIELTRNAKGDYQYVTKVYFADGEHEQALVVIRDIERQLHDRYVLGLVPDDLTPALKASIDKLEAERLKR